MEQLKVCTNDLPSVAKKKVVVTAASLLSRRHSSGAGDQYPWSEDRGGVLELWPKSPASGGGCQYPVGGGGGGNVGGFPIAGDPPHGIMGVGPV
jgi:hypothetical protein